jgi:polar amino acid transport system substrate-binding protein
MPPRSRPEDVAKDGLMNRKLIVAIAATGLTIGCLAGCTSQSGGQPATTTGAQSSDILATILRTHVLNVATEQGIPGYEYITANGQPAGFDIDIIKNIAADLGATPKFTYVNNAARLGAIEAGKVQMVVANFTITPQRASVITFSNPYINEHSELAVSSSSKMQTADQLDQASTTVCLEQGGYLPSVITAVFPHITHFLTLNNISDCAAALQAGRVTAMAQDGFDLGELLKVHPGSIRIIPDSFFLWELEGIGIPNGDQAWLNWLNQWVYNFVNSPLEAQLFQKNFGFPLPSFAQQIAG